MEQRGTNDDRRADCPPDECNMHAAEAAGLLPPVVDQSHSCSHGKAARRRLGVESEMRILVVVAHYFRYDPGQDMRRGIGSSRAPFAKIAAFNAQMVALHRYFGPLRRSLNPGDPQAASGSRDRLDIVVLTSRDSNLLKFIGIEEPAYDVEYFDGPPLMLEFEAQRIMRDRAGAYDVYAFMEDDLILDDPEFFAKVAWFEANFGEEVLLQAVRYEMPRTGTLARVAIEPHIAKEFSTPFMRPHLQPTLTGIWNGVEQRFYLPGNPHAGCFFLTERQLSYWMRQPSFYDRDTSWIGPLESAATLAPGKVFGLYKADKPDPWFLAIEHYGTRFASEIATEESTYGEEPLLALIETMMVKGVPEVTGEMIDRGAFSRTINMLAGENYAIRKNLHSRSWLARSLLKAIWDKSRAP